MAQASGPQKFSFPKKHHNVMKKVLSEIKCIDYPQSLEALAKYFGTIIFMKRFGSVLCAHEWERP